MVILGFILNSCHVARFFWWNFADINDGEKFYSVPVRKANQPFVFNTGGNSVDILAPVSLSPIGHPISFDQLLQKNKTVSFLVIRNDSILYEKYFKDYTNASAIPSFSVSKSFVSALIGIAIDEGSIKSVDQKVTDFLPDLKDPGFASISVSDLLNMRSGIKFAESYGNPFAAMPRFYYGTNLMKMIRKLKTKDHPDKYYDYQSVNTILLTLILEKATGVPANVYLQEKIWKPLGMEADASWNVDNKKNLVIKSNCCINAHTRDFARFGRLYLNKGNWEGHQIISSDWIRETLSITNDSRDSQGYPYKYHWRVMPDGQMFAKGILGQYIYINPEKQVIIIRLGSATGDIHWIKLFQEICNHL